MARELVFLVLIGVTGGTALGVLVSRLWIPYFRVGSEALAESLPMPVRFTWTAMLGLHALFGLLLTGHAIFAGTAYPWVPTSTYELPQPERWQA